MLCSRSGVAVHSQVVVELRIVGVDAHEAAGSSVLQPRHPKPTRASHRITDAPGEPELSGDASKAASSASTALPSTRRTKPAAGLRFRR